jgi:hypothetical protein
MDMDHEAMSVELNLAAAMALLSSSVLRGPTPAKAKALRLHLQAISRAPDIAFDLRNTAASLLAQWDAVQCHPVSRPVERSPADWMSCSETTH